MNAPRSHTAHSFCDAALECIHGTFPASVLNPTINDGYGKNAISSLTTMLTCAQAAESSVGASNEMGLLQISIFVKTITSDGTSKWALHFSSFPVIQTSALPSDPLRVPRHSTNEAMSPAQSQVTGFLGRVGERKAIGGNDLDLQEEVEASKGMTPTNTNVSGGLIPHASTGVQQRNYQNLPRIPLPAVLTRPSSTQVHVIPSAIALEVRNLLLAGGGEMTHIHLSQNSWPDIYQFMYYRSVGIACQRVYEGRKGRLQNSEFTYYSLIPPNFLVNRNKTCKFNIVGLSDAIKSVKGNIPAEGFQLDLGNRSNSAKHVLFTVICLSWSAPGSQVEGQGRKGSRNVLNAWRLEGLGERGCMRFAQKKVRKPLFCSREVGGSCLIPSDTSRRASLAAIPSNMEHMQLEVFNPTQCELLTDGSVAAKGFVDPFTLEILCNLILLLSRFLKLRRRTLFTLKIYNVLRNNAM